MNKLALLIPVGLGLAAGVMNFLAVKSSVQPIDVITITSDAKPGAEITTDRIAPLSLRADKKLLRSAIRWEDRAVILNRRLNRDLAAGEILLMADLRLAENDPKSNLKEGEASLTFSAPAGKIAPGTRVGDEIMVQVQEGNADEEGTAAKAKGVRLIGPFRIVSLGEAPPLAIRDATRTIVVGVLRKKNNPEQYADPNATLLELCARPKAPGEAGTILGVEFAVTAK